MTASSLSGAAEGLTSLSFDDGQCRLLSKAVLLFLCQLLSFRSVSSLLGRLVDEETQLRKVFLEHLSMRPASGGDDSLAEECALACELLTAVGDYSGFFGTCLTVTSAFLLQSAAETAFAAPKPKQSKSKMPKKWTKSVQFAHCIVAGLLRGLGHLNGADGLVRFVDEVCC